MAEAVGVLGAAAASAQFAVYATKTFIYLRDLVTKMKAAPEDVQNYTAHIEQLIAVTDLFKNNPALHATIEPILQACCTEAQQMGDLMKTLAFNNTDRWYRSTKKKARVAMMEKEVNQMFVRLEREKTSLIVAIAQIDRSV